MTFISDWTLICFEHKVEFTNCCIFSFFASTSWTVDVFINESFHFFMTHCINRFVCCKIICCTPVFNQFICTVSSLTFKTVNHWIREAVNMTRSLPCCVMLENCRIKTNYIIVKLSHVMPPCILNVAFEIYAQRTVIPGTSLSTIDFRSLINKTTSFTKRNDFVQCTRVCIFFVCHL